MLRESLGRMKGKEEGGRKKKKRRRRGALCGGVAGCQYCQYMKSQGGVAGRDYQPCVVRERDSEQTANYRHQIYLAWIE